jgi:hypothetical protein
MQSLEGSHTEEEKNGPTNAFPGFLAGPISIWLLDRLQFTPEAEERNRPKV